MKIDIPNELVQRAQELVTRFEKDGHNVKGMSVNDEVVNVLSMGITTMNSMMDFNPCLIQLKPAT